MSFTRFENNGKEPCSLMNLSILTFLMALMIKMSPFSRDSDLGKIKELFPNSRTVTVPNAGHWVHSDNPSGFLKAAAEIFCESDE